MSGGEGVPEWKTMWGAKIKWPADMSDDMLKDAVETTRAAMAEFPDFEADGQKLVKKIKAEFDSRWGPHWHCVVGKSFGCYATHESRR